jgi:hypothetical protein
MTSSNQIPGRFRDGKHIKAARAIAGLRRVDLATAAKLHPNTVKYWECSRRRWVADGNAIDQISAALASFGVDTEVERQGNRVVAIVRMR